MTLKDSLRSFAVLLAMTGLAITQPVLSVFGASPETFVFAGADRFDIVVFALAVALAPPIALLAGEFAVALVGTRAGKAVHLGLVGALGAAAITQAAPVALAVVGGAALSVGYSKVPSVRQALRYLAPAPVAFVGLFLFASPVSDLVLDRPVTAGSPVASTVPVVVMVFDEFPLSTLLGPDGTIDAELYPHLDEFAATSTWYRNATTTHGLTLQAVPAILSGQDPGFDDPPALATEYPDNLFTLFGATHELNVSEALTRLCPPSLCDDSSPGERSGPVGSLLDRAWQVWGDRLSGEAGVGDLTGQYAETVGTQALSTGSTSVFGTGDRAGATPRRMEDWLDRLDGLRGRPSLSAIHLILPHAPWTFLPSGHTYDAPAPEATGFLNGWPDGSGWPALLGRQRHVLQTQYLDTLVGQTMDRLDDAGIFDDAIVVLVADHGANFVTPENLRAASPDNYEQIMWVPMLVKAPGQRTGTIDDSDVRVVDVLPTIAELAGIDLPFPTDGVAAGTTAGTARDERDLESTKPFHQMNKPPLMDVEQRLIEVDPTTGFDRVQARRFSPDPLGPSELRAYRVGPEPTLIAMPTDDLAKGTDHAGSAIVDGDVIGRLEDVDLSRRSIPVFLSGTIDAPVGTRVVVSVNGRVASVSEVFADVPDGQRFAAMVPESLLRDGNNEPRLFTLTGDDDTHVLHLVRVRDSHRD